jgi:hypothetical protein
MYSLSGSDIDMDLDYFQIAVKNCKFGPREFWNLQKLTCFAKLGLVFFVITITAKNWDWWGRSFLNNDNKNYLRKALLYVFQVTKQFKSSYDRCTHNRQILCRSFQYQYETIVRFSVGSQAILWQVLSVSGVEMGPNACSYTFTRHYEPIKKTDTNDGRQNSSCSTSDDSVHP